MTVYAITDTKKGRTGIAPTYLQSSNYPSHTHTYIHTYFICYKVGQA